MPFDRSLPRTVCISFCPPCVCAVCRWDQLLLSDFATFPALFATLFLVCQSELSDSANLDQLLQKLHQHAPQITRNAFQLTFVSFFGATFLPGVAASSSSSSCSSLLSSISPSKADGAAFSSAALLRWRSVARSVHYWLHFFFARQWLPLRSSTSAAQISRHASPLLHITRIPAPVEMFLAQAMDLLLSSIHDLREPHPH